MWPDSAAQLDTGIMISNNQYPTPAAATFVRTVAQLRPGTFTLGSDRGKLRPQMHGKLEDECPSVQSQLQHQKFIGPTS